MYLYQSALVLDYHKKGRWAEADVRHTPVSTLFEDYGDVYLILTHSVLTHPVSLLLDDVRLSHGANRVDLTVEGWLASLGDRSLPTSNVIPKIETHYAEYRDAWSANYTIEPVSKTAHPTVELPKGSLTDLRITRDGVDYKHMYEQCMVSVNGLFHLTNLGDDALYVDDGAQSGFKANQNSVGLYQLGKLGKLQFVKVTKDMLFKNSDRQKFADYAYIKLPFVPKNKTVAMVIGGYLHFLDNVLRRTGEDTFSVDFNNLPYVERFFQSRQLMDLSEMEDLLETSPNNPNQFIVEELYSDEIISEYLTLTQSFFVIIDTPQVFVDKIELGDTQLPGRYVHGSHPDTPLITQYGLMPEYWVTEESGMFVLSLNNNLRDNYNFFTHQYKNALSVDPTRSTTRPYELSRGQLLIVGKDM